jgi:nicotinamidase-related amidase
MFPSFYEASKVKDIYVERVQLIADAAKAHRDKHSPSIRPASDDKLRIAAFGIDAQVGFSIPEASLFVPGAVEDTQRTIEWIYRNLDRITSLHYSLDTHRVFQVFHPAWWVDQQGNHPAPFATISADDVRQHRFTPAIKEHRAEGLEYVERLEKNGKYVLTIWPYHALLGGISHALVPALMEATMFHSLVRGAQTQFEIKGTNELTENYSVLSPEVTELQGRSVGAFNEPFFNALMKYDRVYVFGQAKSHCVLSTLRDMQQRINQTNDPASLIKKIFILEDATSPVPPPPINPLPPALDFPRIANEAFAELAAAGMNLVKTTDPIAD